MFFEDYLPGRVTALRTDQVTEDDIVEFARRYDPQPFHLDSTSAAAAPYGAVIASGWHVCALAGHALVSGFLSEESSLPSPGADEVRWHAPVRAGDMLTWQATVLDRRPSQSRPDRGIVRTRLEAHNQEGVTVVSLTIINMIRRRPAAPEPPD
jgi:acyl dehydratase